jgi:hypothetical protein
MPSHAVGLSASPLVSVGGASGAIAFALDGFVAVLTMIALAAIIGATLSRGIPETA